jgi:hypothetical protein
MVIFLPSVPLIFSGGFPKNCLVWILGPAEPMGVQMSDQPEMFLDWDAPKLRTRARECLEAAQLATDADTRRRLLEKSLLFAQRAESLERNGAGDPVLPRRRDDGSPGNPRA